jgi:hypothetical protein
MERDQPSNAIGVIIGMRNDHRQAAAHLPPTSVEHPRPLRTAAGVGLGQAIEDVSEQWCGGNRGGQATTCHSRLTTRFQRVVPAESSDMT